MEVVPALDAAKCPQGVVVNMLFFKHPFAIGPCRQTSMSSGCKKQRNAKIVAQICTNHDYYDYNPTLSFGLV